MKKYIFFRVDDIGEYDERMVKLTNIFIKSEVKASYQVIPTLIDSETEQFLKEPITAKYICDIGQHGYQHKDWGGGEFCRYRTYKEQKSDIEEGLKIIKSKFSNRWHGVFCFPYGSYDENTIGILKNNLEYKIYSKYVGFSKKKFFFNKAGRLIGRNKLLGKYIDYHGMNNGNLLELSVCIDFNKDYDTGECKDLGELLDEYNIASKYIDYIGFVIHPNHINNEEDLNVIDNLIKNLKKLTSVKFCTMGKIYSILSNEIISEEAL